MTYTAKDREYFQKNKVKILEKRRRKRAENPEWAAVERKKARAASLAWYHKNKHKVKEKRANRTAKEVRRQKGHDLKKNYGIAIEDYEALVTAQDGKCAICGKRKTLCVDHDHATGEVRSLLCRWCNTMLGDADDDPSILMAGALYIEEHSSG